MSLLGEDTGCELSQRMTGLKTHDATAGTAIAGVDTRNIRSK